MALTPLVSSPPPLDSVNKADVLAGSLRAADPTKPLMNFSPGPTSLPQSVMESIQTEFHSVNDCGMSALELSHRSPEFLRILSNTKAKMRKVLNVPDNFKIIFCQGGGHGQFAAVPLNLAGPGESREALYVVSGTWSRRAADEARKFADVRVVGRRGATSQGEGLILDEGSSSPTLPSTSTTPVRARGRKRKKAAAKAKQARRPPAYVYVCSNETADGFELTNLDDVARLAAEEGGGAPLVVDASSDLGSKRVQWEHIGALFACTPKNLGHPGLTIVFAREDLVNGRRAQPNCPGFMDWEVLDDSDCLWNTPPTFNIYTTGKVMEWMEREGGVEEMERRTNVKAAALWSVIENSDGFFSTPSMSMEHRSRSNVPFDVCGGDQVATEEFLLKAHAANIVGLRTMTPFGFGNYLRASLYNSVPVENAVHLAGFMEQFAAEHQHLKHQADLASEANMKEQEQIQQIQIQIQQQQQQQQIQHLIQRQMHLHQQTPWQKLPQPQQQQAMHFHTTAEATEP